MKIKNLCYLPILWILCSCNEVKKDKNQSIQSQTSDSEIIKQSLTEDTLYNQQDESNENEIIANNTEWDKLTFFENSESTVEENETYKNDLILGISYAINVFEGKYRGEYWQNHFNYEDIKNELSGEMEYTEVTIPREQRTLKHNEMLSKGELIYANMVDYVSENRYNIDFLNLYYNNKHIIRQIINKETFDRNYAKELEDYLIAYNIILNEEDFIEKLEETIYAKEFGLELDKEQEENVYNHLYDTISGKHPEVGQWANYELFDKFSFWARRYHEENMNNIYETLITIKNDYE